MSDKYEPYLEPLFLPGVFSLLFYGLHFYEFSFGFAGVGVRSLILVVLVLWVLSSIFVIIYEILLMLGVVIPRCIIKDVNNIYSQLRIIFAIWGVISIVLVGGHAYGAVDCFLLSGCN